RQEGRLVHHAWRRVPGGKQQDDPLSARRPRRQAQLSLQELVEGCRAMEPLLRPRDQRRSAPVGQRPGSLGRDELRSQDRLPVPRIGRFARRVPTTACARVALSGAVASASLSLLIENAVMSRIQNNVNCAGSERIDGLLDHLLSKIAEGSNTNERLTAF